MQDLVSCVEAMTGFRNWLCPCPSHQHTWAPRIQHEAGFCLPLQEGMQELTYNPFDFVFRHCLVAAGRDGVLEYIYKAAESILRHGHECWVLPSCGWSWVAGCKKRGGTETLGEGALPWKLVDRTCSQKWILAGHQHFCGTTAQFRTVLTKLSQKGGIKQAGPYSRCGQTLETDRAVSP